MMAAASTLDMLNGSSANYRYRARCPKCATEFAKPPRNWDCPKCGPGTKTWQPDDAVDACQVCSTPVAKFSRHHCRSCGLVTCTTCTQCTTLIPEWSATEKQRCCKRCAVPSSPPTMEGSLDKLGQKHAFFGEKFAARYFELREAVLCYRKDKDREISGQIDLAHAKIIDVAIHPHAFCLIGPKLPRGYVLSAQSAEMKRKWVDAITRAVTAAAQRDAAAGGTGLAEEDDEARTVAVLYDESTADGTGAASSAPPVSMADFEILTVLGLGSFGRVMKVRQRRTGYIYAMKVLDKQQIVQNKMVTHTQAEKAILTEVVHPFVVKLHFAFQTRRHLVLVLDFLCGGELFFHLQRNKRFHEGRARFYAAEIGLALEYIHSKNIIYRDLKPENLVLDRFGHVTLTDFGLAKREVRDTTHTFCGTPEYMAPELIQKKGHSKAVDWWSLGIFLYEMVHGLPPFYTQNVSEMYDMILHKPLTFPSSFSPELKSLLSRLLERDPSKRLATGEEYRRHPFFRDIDWEALYRREVRPEFEPDVRGNDLKYFDKQFTQESTKVAHLDQPNDPNDPNSRRFEGFEYSSPLGGPAAAAAAASAGSPAAGAPRSGGRAATSFPTSSPTSPSPPAGAKPDPSTDANL